jgi:DNA invertase Pin-like site-specific DNA recombinase
MSAKPKVAQLKSRQVFGQTRKPAKMLRVGIYARVSTLDQQTQPMQIRALREYAVKRGWAVVVQVKEVGSGAAARQLRQQLIEAARRRSQIERLGK